MPRATATHAVCPLCGKSSSLRSFPSGSGTDIVLQSFRGKGRGRGFEAIPAGSGLSDPELAKAVQEKVRTIAQAFEAHGLPMGLSLAARDPDAPFLRESISALEGELNYERTLRKALETQARDLAAELDKDRHLRMSTLAQVGKLSAQLDRATAAQEHLFAASRRCIVSLRALREQLKGVPFAAQSLSPLVHDVKGVVDLIQELRLVASIRSAAETDDLVTR